MVNQTSILTFSELEIGYPNNSLIGPFSLTANLGELIALMGLNGTGKTTLFKTILKEITPLAGRVLFGNKELTIDSLQHHISVVYTERISIFGYTVFDMVAMGRMPHTNRFGKLSVKDKEVISMSLNALNLEEIADTQINNLSDGQFQKVMIAKSLAQETPILLLDEPTAFLDIKNKKMIHELLIDLSKNHNKTIIVSTHDLAFCNSSCDKVWLAKNNSLIKKSSTEIKESDFD